MSYSAEINRQNPTCFLFLIDQSGSMEDKMDSGKSKALFLADVLNKTLYSLVINCTKADGLRKYFDVGVIAYGGTGVASGYGGALNGQMIQPITAVEQSPLRVEERSKKVDDGAGGVIEQKIKFPIWFDPTSSGGTPMCEGFRKVAEVLAQWCDNHPNSYPPTILHVTDGQSTDGVPEDIAENVRKLSTGDGECLIFNLHVTNGSSREVIFPASEAELPDEYSRMLYRMSSIFPSHLANLATDKGYKVTSESRGFIYNAGPEFIVDFFEIGTRPKLLADR